MDLIKLLFPFLGGILTIVLLEYIWLMHIMNAYIVRSFGDLVITENGKLVANIIPGVLAWIVIVGMWYIFVIRSWYANSYLSTVSYGALIWGCTYAIYDFTNLSFIKNYPLNFSYIDIIWGAFLWACVCLSMYYISIKIA